MSSEREIEARVRRAAERAAERRHKEALREEAQEQPALFRRSELEGQGELFEEELDRLEARWLTLVKLERTECRGVSSTTPPA